ncbi:MAG: tetratricopeptide repeat protein [Pseudomonadales bacterium]|nr:tetratricopeptide repeat protein [Pseudomonadales bacterium]
MKPLTKTITIFALIVQMVACASFDQSTSKPAPPPPAPITEEPIAAEKHRDFAPETLYALLTAEIAGQRNRFDVTLLNYVQQAKKTRDLGVVKRAVQISQFLKASNALTDLGELWLELEPGSAEPHQILAFQFVAQGDYERAMHHMEQIYLMSGSADFESLAVHSKSLSVPEKQTLMELYADLAQRYPDNFDLGYSYALVQRNNEQHQAALDTISHYLAQDPEYQPGLLLKATLLYDVGQMSNALDLLSDATQRFPENRKLGTLYARMLIDDNQLEQSEEEYRKLVKRFPDVPGLRLAHSLVALENNNLDVAVEGLETLVKEGQHLNEAHFYLGRTADQRGDHALALNHYEQISSGGHYYNALARSSFLRASEGQLDEVMSKLATLREDHPQQVNALWQIEINLLMDLEKLDVALERVNEAIKQHPDSSDLRYARAMLYERQDLLPEMEADLRFILQAEPENSIAMNALGYTLADKTDRYLEAFELINNALKINPKSPAIIDSLGWVYYKMGDMEQALAYLRQAYDQFPDPEVAAHLGEVLWETGEEKEALEIWQKAYQTDPVHRILQRILNKYGVKFE